MGLTRIRAEQISDIDYKQAVRVITVSNVTLTGGAPNTVDSVVLVAGDRILVAGQNTGSQNGLYDVTILGTGANGTWSRTADGDVTGEIQAGMIVMVTEGTTYKDTQWKLTTNNPIVIGTTALTFEQNSGYAFGNLYANGTAVLANAASGTVTLTAGDNIAITGNNTSKTVTIAVTGISLNSISNGTSNVNVISSGGNVTVGIGGTSNIAVFSTSGLDVTGRVTATGNITGGNLSGTLLTGTLATAAQPNVTSVGTLTSLNSGTISSSGNVTGANLLTGGLITATGNVTGGNLLTGGLVSATGNINAGNAILTGVMQSTGNARGGNLLTTGLISATGNLDAGNLRTAGLVSATGSITSAAGVTATGNVTGGNVTTAGLITATGNVTGGNLITAGLITATGAITGASINVPNAAQALTATPSPGFVLEPSFQPTYIGTQPFGSSMWADKLRFIQPNTVETSTDGVAWSATTNTTYTQLPFNGIVTQSTIPMNGTTLKGLRWTWSANIQFSAAYWLGIAFQFATPAPTVTVQFETSTDGVSWTSRYTTSAITVSNEWVYIYTPEPSYSVQYYRITLLQQTGTVNFNALQWYTARPGDQGSGQNNYFPFTYDFGKNVTFGNTVSVTGNTTIGNLLTAGLVSATGNVTGGNITTAGIVTATGNVQGGNLLTAGLISAAGNLTAGNITTAGAFSVTGNITGGNLLTAGLISATGNITGGNVLGGANVNATTHTGATVSVTGNITGGNLLTGGLISATSTITSAANVTGGNITTAGLITATGNVTGGNITTAGLVTATGNITGGNLLTAGLISATGNITGGNVNTGTVRNSAGALTISTGSGAINLNPAGGNVVLSANTYINNVAQPLQNQDAATKLYVDNAVSTAISYHQPVTAATTTTLATTTGGTITYAQPGGAGNGVGATITTTGSFNLIDTANVQTANTRILVKDEANAVLNGVYIWSNATVITRSSDTNTYGAGNVSALGLNDYFFVQSGNVNAGSAWVVNAPTGTITFGTSNITFAQFSSSQTYTANTSAGLSLTGTVFSAKTDGVTTGFDAGGNIRVIPSATLTTPNIGAATGTSLSVTGNVTGGNLNTGGLVTATGNVTGGNVTTAGVVTATGNIQGGNILTGGLISATGNLTAGNVNTAGLVTATGNIQGGNLRTAGLITATGNIDVGNVRTAGLVSATGSITSASGITGTGNVTGGNLTTAGLITATGNITGGNLLTAGLISATSTITSAANVVGGNITTAGLITATGNITGGNLLTAGLVSATGNLAAANGRFTASNVTVTITDSFATSTAIKNLNIVSGTRDVAVIANLGGGSYNNLTTVNDSGLIFTGPQQGNANFVIAPWASGTSGIRISSVSNVATITLAAANTSVSGNVIPGNVLTAGLISATGNVTGGNLITSGLITATGNITGGNVNTAGLISAAGNITANNFIGNGAFTSFLYDDVSSATDGIRGTFPLRYNQVSQTVSDPFALEVSVNGAVQPTFVWNSDVLWQTFALGTFKGYTIISTGNITFTTPPLPNSDINIQTSFGKVTAATKRAPFLPADIVLGT